MYIHAINNKNTHTHAGLVGIGKTGRGAGAGGEDYMVKTGTGNREIT